MSNIHFKKLNEFVNEKKINEDDYYRLPKKMIGNELHTFNRNVESFVGMLKHGDDFNMELADRLINSLNNFKSNAKKFKSGTKPPKAYESENK
jgi:hypothetical protein